MIVPRSVPGDWFAVVVDGVAVMLPPRTPAGLLDAVWDTLRDGGDVVDVRRVVADEVRACGALSVVGGAVQAVLLGDVVLSARTARGDDVRRGEPDRWQEHHLRDVDGLVLEAVGATRLGADALPVLAAVVPSAAVELGLVLRAGLSPAAEEPSSAAAPSADAHVVDLPDDLDDDGDTVLQVTAELRAQVDALAAAAAHPAAPAHPGAPADASPAASSEEQHDYSLDEDHLDAMTILGVDHSLRAEVDALAAEAERSAGTGSATAPADADGHLAPHPPVPLPDASGTLPRPAAHPVLPPPPAPLGPVAASTRVDAAADHDGLTVMSSDLVEIRKNLPTWTGDRVPGPFAVPAERGTAKLVMSSGLVVTLERTVLIGRAPVVSRVPNRSLPRLVTVPSPHHDISRTHVQVQDDGDRVFLTDLHSTNGVVVHGAGSAAVRLAPGVPTLLVLGATVDIGDGVTFSVVRDR
ncbi:FHA domain-containing protein [Sanguibacter massiliensis]|uniref:FHA domain-containing protein n=1 Tax=Sanguibacter massiliensis TaxID=1973217 RepID=UPI000C8261C3|nr:FHA domain-containing protein [Sanguibacter massiliensis]